MYKTSTQISVRTMELDKVLLGVYPEEKNRPTCVVIDACCRIIKTPSDDQVPTLDYAQMHRMIETVAMRGHFNLVETLATEIAHALLGLSSYIEDVTVGVRKPKALSNGVAEVTVSMRKMQESE